MIKNCGIQFVSYIFRPLTRERDRKSRNRKNDKKDTYKTVEAKIIRDTCSKLFDWQRIQQRVSCKSYFPFVLSPQSFLNPFSIRPPPTTISPLLPSNHISSPNFFHRFQFAPLSSFSGRELEEESIVLDSRSFSGKRFRWPSELNAEAVQISSCSMPEISSGT